MKQFFSSAEESMHTCRDAPHDGGRRWFEEEELLNKVLYFLVPFLNMLRPLLSVEGQKALGFNLKSYYQTSDDYSIWQLELNEIIKICIYECHLFGVRS